MLPVNIEQLLTYISKLGCGSRAAIYPGSTLPVGVNGAPQQEAVTQLKSGFVKPYGQRGGSFKLCAHICSAGAFTDEADIRSPTGYQL